MSPGDIPPPYEYIQPNQEPHRFKGLDELMEMKYGGETGIGGYMGEIRNFNLARASFYAFLFGILLMLAAPLLLAASPPVLGLVRDTFGVGSTFFAIRAYLNFSTGGLTNLVGFQSWVFAVILYGLSRRSR